MIIICDLKVYKIPPIILLTLKTRLTLSLLFESASYVIVIPWVVRLYVEIIHEL